MSGFAYRGIVLHAINISTIQQISMELLFSGNNLVRSYLEYLGCWWLEGVEIPLSTEYNSEYDSGHKDYGVGVLGSDLVSSWQSHRAPRPVRPFALLWWFTMTDSHGQSWTVSQTFRECQILIMKYFWAWTVQLRYKHLNIPYLVEDRVSRK